MQYFNIMIFIQYFLSSVPKPVTKLSKNYEAHSSYLQIWTISL